MSELKSSKQRIVEAALELFHLQGVKGTSIDEVLKRAEAGKGQFAHYFKNKEGLVLAVVEYLQEVIRSGQVDSNYTFKSWEDFDSWFGRYIKFQTATECELSCPLGTIGNDITAEQEHLRLAVKTFFEWSTSQLARFFAERRAAKELDPAANPDALADLCMAVMEGGMLMTKINRSPKLFTNAAQETLRYIKLLRR
jgi:TetR/AcrR family transcriptional repressor of nem operon